ncbi:MAG: GNAT family N-acetyltransferase [Alphaproteobacteria bacterium]|nr:GNAT family N-acetyltransferase [Alphaproteobacteria bacterium]
MKTSILETGRLILRPLTLEDAPAVQKYFNDWEIIKNLSKVVPWPYPDDGAEDFIKNNALPRMREKGHLIWAITLKENPGEAIGIIDFGHERSLSHGDRGFWIARPFQGRGLMSEAIAAVNDYLFFEVGLEKFTVLNAKSNITSRRVKEKTGAVFIGLTELEHHSGETEAELWDITRENWEKIKNGRDE